MLTCIKSKSALSQDLMLYIMFQTRRKKRGELVARQTATSYLHVPRYPGPQCLCPGQNFMIIHLTAFVIMFTYLGIQDFHVCAQVRT